MSSRFYIRLESKHDIPVIRKIHQSVFPTWSEAELVDYLQSEGDGVLSLVARRGGALAGHILFSRLTAVESMGLKAVALGPLAVLESYQGKGVGTALVSEGIKILHGQGVDVIFVLGDPAFYGRFGFTAEQARNFETPYDGPNQQALALTERGRYAHGLIRYAPAFADLPNAPLQTDD
ncbi:GNAT family N-acetyltransferase [Flaviflagellibacter deserti]|jgi:putative acetyltransferase|uniref:GNAT family N-acetyltransferase n=1 Tax=Flaviflagellibacter deserti TaxID=2267266 RepID=A0ABV9YXI0_9HYPH